MKVLVGKHRALPSLLAYEMVFMEKRSVVTAVGAVHDAAQAVQK